MKTFEIIQRNRKYFAAKLDGKYPCKILIDANSETLELGTQTLEVDDISVRSKYGTDLIFKLSAPADAIAEAGVCTLRTPFYNQNLVDECHNLGGKWDTEEKAWIFSGIVADKVEQLDEKYNSELVNVEIRFKESAGKWHGPVTLAGFKIATAWGRDSGAKLAEGISLLEGAVNSGGSVKNWSTRVEAGTVIRMQIPRLCLGDIDQDVDVKEI